MSQPGAGDNGRDLALDGLQQRLLPLADLVMVVMLSRPQSGTLRNTRVTVATNILAAGVALAALVLGVVLLIRTMQGHRAVWLLLEVPLLAVAIGCADLALFGIRQALLLRG